MRILKKLFIILILCSNCFAAEDFDSLINQIVDEEGVYNHLQKVEFIKKLSKLDAKQMPHDGIFPYTGTIPHRFSRAIDFISNDLYYRKPLIEALFVLAERHEIEGLKIGVTLKALAFAEDGIEFSYLDKGIPETADSLLKFVEKNNAEIMTLYLSSSLRDYYPKLSKHILVELKSLGEALESAGDYASNSKELGLGYKTYFSMYSQLGLENNLAKKFFDKMTNIYIENELISEVLKPLFIKEAWLASDRRRIIKEIKKSNLLESFSTRKLLNQILLNNDLNDFEIANMRALYQNNSEAFVETLNKYPEIMKKLGLYINFPQSPFLVETFLEKQKYPNLTIWKLLFSPEPPMEGDAADHLFELRKSAIKFVLDKKAVSIDDKRLLATVIERFASELPSYVVDDGSNIDYLINGESNPHMKKWYLPEYDKLLMPRLEEIPETSLKLGSVDDSLQIAKKRFLKNRFNKLSLNENWLAYFVRNDVDIKAFKQMKWNEQVQKLCVWMITKSRYPEKNQAAAGKLLNNIKKVSLPALRNIKKTLESRPDVVENMASKHKYFVEILDYALYSKLSVNQGTTNIKFNNPIYEKYYGADICNLYFN